MNAVVLVTNALIFFLISNSRDNVDVPSYLIAYANPYKFDESPQVLFYGLIKFFKHLDFSFFEFRSIIVFVCLSMIYVFFEKISLNIHLMYSSYMSYLIFFDYIQFRNFFAASLFYIALSFVVKGGGKWKVWFAICLVLASLIHSSFWAYLLFLLIPTTEWQNSRIIKTIAFSTLIFSIIAVFFRSSLAFATDIISVIDYEKGSRYAELSSNFGGIYYIFLHTFSTLSVGYLVRQYNNMPGLEYAVNYDAKVVDLKKNLRMIFYIDLLAFALCPLVVFSITFHRLLRNLFLINVAAFSMFGLKNRSLWVTFFFLSYLLLWMFVGFSGEDFQRLVIPLFETNTFCINEISL